MIAQWFLYSLTARKRETRTAALLSLDQYPKLLRLGYIYNSAHFGLNYGTVTVAVVLRSIRTVHEKVFP